VPKVPGKRKRNAVVESEDENDTEAAPQPSPKKKPAAKFKAPAGSTGQRKSQRQKR
jgi:hypothetical protein